MKKTTITIQIKYKESDLNQVSIKITSYTMKINHQNREKEWEKKRELVQIFKQINIKCDSLFPL